MTKEYAPGGLIDEGYVWTIDEYGEEIKIPVSAIPELRHTEYPWADAMVVKFDDETGGIDG